MRHLVTGSLLVVALIHLLPVVGVLGASKLRALYGLDALDPTTALLLRHRAVLFGLLGGFLAIAAFVPACQVAALVAGFVSVLSFLFLARAYRDLSPPIARVFRADLLALVALLVGSGALVSLR